MDKIKMFKEEFRDDNIEFKHNELDFTIDIIVRVPKFNLSYKFTVNLIEVMRCNEITKLANSYKKFVLRTIKEDIENKIIKEIF